MTRWPLVVAALLFVVGCALPTEPRVARGACRSEAEFCDGLPVRPLDDVTVRWWQDAANDYVDDRYGVGKRAYPAVTWKACFFDVNGVCAAGWTESKRLIYVSTAQPERTGPLIAHETQHARYWEQFGDPDASHKRKYGW